MTTVPPRPAIPPGRGKRVDTRKYSWQSWVKGYAAWALLLPIYLALWAFATLCPRLPKWATRKLLLAHIRYTSTHDMDFRIPPDKSVPAYMHRWWRIARNAYMNIYYHVVLRSDDDRALHDHPWWNFSIVLEGGYYEHTILPGGVHRKVWYGPGSVRFRRAGTFAHRLELKTTDMPGLIREIADWPLGKTADMHARADGSIELPVTTIFITGPVLRRWGFHHPEQWVDAYDWDDFNAARGSNGGMRMDGGSDAAQSARNRHNAN